MLGGRVKRILGALAALLLVGAGTGMAQPAGAQSKAGGVVVNNEDNRHAGYYYPPLTSTEVYKARGQVLQQATRETRLAFVTGLTQQQMSRPYPPNFAIFAKGEDAEKMIIVSIGDTGFRGIYQARALLAQLTAVSRTSQLLRDFAVEDLFTFLDLARMLGFEQLTISDGDTFAHQIEIR
ncbi:molybdopterin-guanine dinucleotide biosynthesis protein A [Ferrovibrio sp.]|uniref:molybdopterin-guanine dinucleotide biosynthesis protein A n=1 Tax=Ferrovibrio sp. TaxID=1917215 RepID=UPI003D0B5B5A